MKTAHVPTARSHELSYCQYCSGKYPEYHQSNQHDCNDCQSNYCHQDNQQHNCSQATTRTQRAPSSTTRRMIASMITSRKRATRPCIMTSPLCQAPAICPEEGVDLVLDLLCILALGLALAQAAGATTTIMSTKMIASLAQPPSVGIHTPRTTMMDITIARTKAIPSLPPSPLRRRRRSAPRNRESHQ
jgi:hypothetical protein